MEALESFIVISSPLFLSPVFPVQVLVEDSLRNGFPGGWDPPIRLDQKAKAIGSQWQPGVGLLHSSSAQVDTPRNQTGFSESCGGKHPESMDFDHFSHTKTEILFKQRTRFDWAHPSQFQYGLDIFDVEDGRG